MAVGERMCVFWGGVSGGVVEANTLMCVGDKGGERRGWGEASTLVSVEKGGGGPQEEACGSFRVVRLRGSGGACSRRIASACPVRSFTMACLFLDSMSVLTRVLLAEVIHVGEELRPDGFSLFKVGCPRSGQHPGQCESREHHLLYQCRP